MSQFAPKEETFEVNGRSFTLRRPGQGGIKRIPLHVARTYSLAPGGEGILHERVGDDIEAEAILFEYLVEAPADWWLTNAKGEPVYRNERKKLRAVDVEDVDPDEFQEVAERARAFHATFRRPTVD